MSLNESSSSHFPNDFLCVNRWSLKHWLNYLDKAIKQTGFNSQLFSSDDVPDGNEDSKDFDEPPISKYDSRLNYLLLFILFNKQIKTNQILL